MAEVFETVQTAGRVYTEALLSLATERQCIDDVADQLDDLMAMWNERKDFLLLMTSAAIDDDARRESLRRIFTGKVHPLLLNFLLVLNNKGRTWLLPEVCRTFHRQVDAQRGRRRAYVTTAVALDDAQRGLLRDEARRMCGLEPILVERVDPAILGGAVLQVGDRVLDSSLRLRLHNMRRDLRDRFDRYLHEGKHRFVTE